MTKLPTPKNYLKALQQIKKQVKSAQIKAHLQVNKEMLILYWQIGNIIINKQQEEGWGAKITQKLSQDLIKAFPSMTGFSYSNIRYMQRFAQYYPDLLICPQAVGKLKQQIFYSDYANLILNIPWGHNREILDKLQSKEQRLWYAKQTIENSWSRNILAMQITTNLYERQKVKKIGSNNFAKT